MTIITFQDQDCKTLKQVPMTKDMLVKDLFNNITKSCLSSSVYSRLIDELKSSLRYHSCQSKHNRVCDVIDATFGKQNSAYSRAMSSFRKLGIILEDKGFLYLNPLVETRTTSKFYELVIEYYNLLWSDEFKSSIHIRYKDYDYTLPTVEGLKQLLIEDEKSYTQHNENLQCLTTDNLYDIVFTFKKAELEDQFPFIDKNELLRLKARLNSIYTNLGNKTMKEIAAAHADILFEQLPIQELDNKVVAFARLPKKWKCIHFSETSTYQEELQQEQQEELMTDTPNTQPTNSQPSSDYYGYSEGDIVPMPHYKDLTYTHNTKGQVVDSDRHLKQSCCVLPEYIDDPSTLQFDEDWDIPYSSPHQELEQPLYPYHYCSKSQLATHSARRSADRALEDKEFHRQLDELSRQSVSILEAERKERSLHLIKYAY